MQHIRKLAYVSYLGTELDVDAKDATALGP
jgi:hypothetical protein